MTYYTYKIINLINGKIYIGKTDNIQKRWNAHKSAARKKDPKDYAHVHRAMNKYGFDNFIIEKIEEFDLEIDALNSEINLITKFKTKNRNIGYNLTDGGEGASGFRFSDDQKKIMSDRRKGKYIGENNPFYGEKHTEKTKNIISNIMKENHQTDKEIYDELNKQQCSLTTERCIEIQEKYLQGNISFEELAKKYSVEITAIWKIIHNKYAAVKGYSIITEDIFQQIKKEKNKLQGENNKQFTNEQEQEIISYYLSCNIRLKDLALKYNVSTPTIRKFFKKNNITIKRDFARGASKSSTLTAKMVLEIREKFATGKYTYKELSKEYPVSVSGIPHIIKRRTWKDI